MPRALLPLGGAAVAVSDFRTQILEWQRRAVGDLRLDPAAALLACAIYCHTSGADSSFSRGELARLGRGSAAAIAAAINQLVLSGYLETLGNRYRARVLDPAAPRLAAITPFPLRRRLAFIRKHGARIATLASKAQADAHLRQQIVIQADALRRKSVPEETIAREIRSLESAIRAEVWRITFGVEAR